LLDRIERLLFGSPAWKLILFLFVLNLIKAGVGWMGNAGYSIEIAQNPFINPILKADDQYVMWNWLGPFLAWMIGCTSKASYFVMNICFSIAFTSTVIITLFQRFEDKFARIGLLLFSMLPVYTTSYHWVGYDSVTLFLMIVALYKPGAIGIAGISGWLLGMQHFEQGSIAAAALLLATLLSKWRNTATTYSILHCVALLAGVALGKLTLTAIFYKFSIHMQTGRMDWLEANLPRLFKESIAGTQYIVWSIFGVGWLAAIKYWEYGKNRFAFFSAAMRHVPSAARFR